MKNPATINQPKFGSPLPKKRKQGKRKGKNGNQPYLQIRHKMRKGMFRKV